jgi:hypothetical protein
MNPDIILGISNAELQEESFCFGPIRYLPGYWYMGCCIIKTNIFKGLINEF